MFVCEKDLDNHKTILPPKEKAKQKRIISDIEYDRWLDQQQMERELDDMDD